MAELTMCYAARMPGERFHFGVAVDKPEYKKFIAEDVSDWIMRGAIVERMTLEKGNKSIGKYFAENSYSAKYRSSLKGGKFINETFDLLSL